MLSSERHSLRFCTAERQHHLSDQTEGGVMDKGISSGKYLILLWKTHHRGQTAIWFLKLWSWTTDTLTVSRWKTCWLYMWIVRGVLFSKLLNVKQEMSVIMTCFKKKRKMYYCSLKSLCLSCKEPSVYNTHTNCKLLLYVCILCFHDWDFLQIK